jgi:CheY-like chemotaxis protein
METTSWCEGPRQASYNRNVAPSTIAREAMALPRRSDLRDRLRNPSPETQRGESNMRNLLLVDDVKTTLAVEKAFLESKNFKVFVTTSAADVMTLAADIQPVLIVMDYEMPEMNGNEVCRRLGEDPRTSHIPVLILSSHNDEKIAQLCRESGAVGFVRKADGRESLLDHVAQILGLPQRRHMRVPCRISVGIRLERERGSRGLIHNLSAGGFYLTLDKSLSQGNALHMSFTLPDSSLVIRVLGEVVRAETLSSSLYGYGIQLLEADADSVEALKQFVKRTV